MRDRAAGRVTSTQSRRGRIHLAIATSLALPLRERDVSPRLLCSITKWCHAAGKLARLLPQSTFRSELLVLTTQVRLLRGECRARTLAYDSNISAAVDAFADAHELRHRSHRLRSAHGGHYQRAWLRKWMLIGMTEYDAIFYTDTDVDIFAPAYNTSRLLDAAGAAHFAAVGSEAAALHAWRERFPTFMADKHAELLATHDREMVVHGGTFIVKPSRTAYLLGLAALRSRRWTARSGFEEAGPPKLLCERRHVGYGVFKRCASRPHRTRLSCGLLCVASARCPVGGFRTDAVLPQVC